jgi:hypothetical protein
MKQLKIILLATCLATFLSMILYAQTDRRANQYTLYCDSFTHPDGPCGHKFATNPGMCWQGPGGQGVQHCEGQAQVHCPLSDTEYHEVNNDFPSGETPDATETCTDSSNSYNIWVTHNKISSPSRQCYRQVECLWDDNLKICTVSVVGVWTSLPKKETAQCPLP